MRQQGSWLRSGGGRVVGTAAALGVVLAALLLRPSSRSDSGIGTGGGDYGTGSYRQPD